MDSNNLKEAIQWYTLYTKVKDTWIEELFESNIRIGKCMIKLNFDKEKIINQFKKTINIFPDRAEPYFILGKYLNDISYTELGYYYLKQVKTKNLEEINNKYVLFVNKYCYGKYVNDELSVACYWTNKGEEGFQLLNEIINDKEFENNKERLEKNKQFFINKYKNLCTS